MASRLIFNPGSISKERSVSLRIRALFLAAASLSVRRRPHVHKRPVQFFRVNFGNLGSDVKAAGDGPQHRLVGVWVLTSLADTAPPVENKQAGVGRIVEVVQAIQFWLAVNEFQETLLLCTITWLAL
jgi:hypothetical protein